MRIIVKDIPVEGLNLSFQSWKDAWFHQILKDCLEGTLKEGDQASGDFFLVRTVENVDCRGKLHFDYHPICVRCLKEFASHHDIPIHLTLAPFYQQAKIEGDKKGDDEEFFQDDIEFSFYHGIDFDLGNIIREQIILALPFTPYCDEACKGLCQFCGKDLNAGLCGCEAKPKESPLAVLKVLQKKQKI